jgi:putative FmdB family regulatory protein
MPTYAYRCPNGHEFDHFFRKMSEAVLTLPCPTCGEPGVRQVSGGAGLVFKGTGFYETDYKRAGQSKNGGEGSESKPTADKPAAPAASPGDGSKKSE